MKKFEAHITLSVADAEDVRAYATNPLAKGWKYSQIDGDPVMGNNPYCYLTAYSPDANDLFEDMYDQGRNLEFAGIKVLRMKIEEIVYDSKTGWDALGLKGTVPI